MSLVHEVNKFSTLYSMHISQSSEAYPALKKFENDNNARILILSLDGSILYLPNQLSNDKESFNELTSFCSELINNKSLINDVTQNSNNSYTHCLLYTSMVYHIILFLFYYFLLNTLKFLPLSFVYLSYMFLFPKLHFLQDVYKRQTNMFHS